MSTVAVKSTRREAGGYVVKAYVLVVTDPGRTRNVTKALTNITHVQTVSEVMGPYDIVIEIIVENIAEIPTILSEEIRTLDGIQSTTSLVAFPDNTSKQG